jgi:hypothetical protein
LFAKILPIFITGVAGKHNLDKVGSFGYCLYMNETSGSSDRNKKYMDALNPTGDDVLPSDITPDAWAAENRTAWDDPFVVTSSEQPKHALPLPPPIPNTPPAETSVARPTAVSEEVNALRALYREAQARRHEEEDDAVQTVNMPSRDAAVIDESSSAPVPSWGYNAEPPTTRSRHDRSTSEAQQPSAQPAEAGDGQHQTQPVEEAYNPQQYNVRQDLGYGVESEQHPVQHDAWEQGDNPFQE